MIYFFVFIIIVTVIIIAIVLINNLIIKKRSSDKTKDIFKLIIAIIISIITGGVGFFLSFVLGEGLVEVLSEKMTMPITFAVVSIYNFIACLFIGRYYPKSIWFSGFFINTIVWLVLITNPRESGGFIDLWWGWAAMIIFAFAGSFIGAFLLKKKPKQSDVA